MRDLVRILVVHRVAALHDKEIVWPNLLLQLTYNAPGISEERPSDDREQATTRIVVPNPSLYADALRLIPQIRM